jgi:hypothetical protein
MAQEMGQGTGLGKPDPSGAQTSGSGGGGGSYVSPRDAFAFGDINQAANRQGGQSYTVTQALTALWNAQQNARTKIFGTFGPGHPAYNQIQATWGHGPVLQAAIRASGGNLARFQKIANEIAPKAQSTPVGKGGKPGASLLPKILPAGYHNPSLVPQTRGGRPLTPAQRAQQLRASKAQTAAAQRNFNAGMQALAAGRRLTPAQQLAVGPAYRKVTATKAGQHAITAALTGGMNTNLKYASAAVKAQQKALAQSAQFAAIAANARKNAAAGRKLNAIQTAAQARVTAKNSKQSAVANQAYKRALAVAAARRVAAARTKRR